MQVTTNRISVFQAVLIGSLTYAVLAFFRKSLIAHVRIETELVQVANATVLYLLILLPGIVVGRLCQRRSIALGFAAGITGEFLRNVIEIVVSIGSMSDRVSVEWPDAAVWLSILLHSVPNGVLAAAGGAVGWAWRQHARLD